MVDSELYYLYTLVPLYEQLGDLQDASCSSRLSVLQ